jgi:hypothetical protein
VAEKEIVRPVSVLSGNWLRNLVAYIENEGYEASVKTRLDELQARRNELTALDAVTPPELDALPDLLPDALARYRDKIGKLEALPTDATPA